MKIIPAIDLMDGPVVRLFKGDPKKKTIYSNDPVEIAKKWQEKGADLLHIVDLDATLGQGTNWKIIQNIAEEISIPIEIAGGLRDESKILEASKFADRVVLGTLAFKDKSMLEKIANLLGANKIVISVDHINGTIVINGWQKNTDTKLIDAITKFIDMGFTEFLLTNVNRDGTMEGPDLEFLQKACEIKNTNVIASGGISSIKDVKDVKALNPFGVILGKALYENKVSIEEAKKLS